MQKRKDEPRPGTSGGKDDKKDGKGDKKDGKGQRNLNFRNFIRSIFSDKAKTEKSDGAKTKRKRDKKNKAAIRAQERRRSSRTQPLRYKAPERTPGLQQSHSVRAFVPRATPEIKEERMQKWSCEYDDSSIFDRDHHDAVDFFIRTMPYAHTEKTLADLRQPARKISHHRLHPRHHHHQDESSLTLPDLFYHTRRCKLCLHVIDECVCQEGHSKPPKSDWAVLVQTELEKPKTFTTSSLGWLEELELDSKVDYRKLINKKFDKSQEICCFPFNTFRIFSKRDIDETDFYKKN